MEDFDKKVVHRLHIIFLFETYDSHIRLYSFVIYCHYDQCYVNR